MTTYSIAMSGRPHGWPGSAPSSTRCPPPPRPTWVQARELITGTAHSGAGPPPQPRRGRQSRQLRRRRRRHTGRASAPLGARPTQPPAGQADTSPPQPARPRHDRAVSPGSPTAPHPAHPDHHRAGPQRCHVICRGVETAGQTRPGAGRTRSRPHPHHQGRPGGEHAHRGARPHRRSRRRAPGPRLALDSQPGLGSHQPPGR